MVTIDDNNSIKSNLYRKPTSGHTVLRFHSFHPPALKKSIPYSQYLRLRRNCIDDADFKIHADNLCVRLKERGYTNTTLKQAFQKACGLTRKEALYKKEPVQDAEPMVRFITTYSNQADKIKQIFADNWFLFKDDQIVSQCLTPYPGITCCRATSLKDKLTKSF